MKTLWYRVALVALSVGYLSNIAHAGNATWTGNDGTSDWNDDFNWDIATPGSTSGTASTDVATFSGAPSITAITIDSYRNVGGITFSGAAANGFTLSGGNLVLTPAGTVQIGAGTGAVTHTLSSAITLAGAGAYNFTNGSTAAGNGSGLVIGGSISNSVAATTATINLAGANGSTGNIVSATISDGAGVVALVKGTGASSLWTLSGANTYSGGTTLNNSGKLLVTNGSGLGTGIVTVGSGTPGVGDTSTLRLGGGIALTGPSSIVLLGARTFPNSGGAVQLENAFGNNSYGGIVEGRGSNLSIASAAGKLTLSGTVTNTSGSGAGSASKQLLLSGAGDGEISGRITKPTPTTRPIQIVKQGTGTWVLSNPDTSTLRNDYKGGTAVNSGVFLINTDNSQANGANSVSTGATLGGSGIIGGATTYSTGSFLTPGAGPGTVGALTFTGTLDLSGLTNGSAGGLLFDLAAVGASDQVLMPTSALTIGSGTLNFDDFAFSLQAGFGAGTYTLFDTNAAIAGALGSSLTGTLGGLNASIGFDLSNQDIILTVSAVPEPQTYAMIAIGIMFLSLRCRRSLTNAKALRSY